MDLNQLRAEYPDLVKQIEQNAVNPETVKKQAAAVERKRLIGLAKIQFGDDAGGKFEAVINSGVTVEQFKAIS